MGGAFLFVGVISGIKEVRTKKIKKNYYVYAEIYDVVVDYSTAVNGVCPLSLNAGM